MIVYLVELSGERARFLPFKDKFKTFLKSEDAIKFAKDNGYDSQMPFDFSLGMKNYYNSGEIEISIIALEVE
jgi:hypothetical protein